MGVSSKSLWRESFKRLFKNKAAVLGGIILIALAFIAIFAPVLAPQPFDEGSLLNNYAKPGPEFPLGADFLGRDLLSRLIYGTRISLLVGLLGAFFAFTIGLAYGTISGYFGGRIDNFMMRFIDVMYAFPDLLFIILLMITFKAGIRSGANQNAFVQSVAELDTALGGMLFIVVGISFTAWVGMARLTRGMALTLRETDFINAAQALGASDTRVIWHHLIPSLLGPLLVRVTLAIPQFIAAEAFLSFIGLGANPPTPSWGIMIAEGFKAMRSHPHLAIYPGIALAITMFAFNFLGDGLRDAFDPRFNT